MQTIEETLKERQEKYGTLLGQAKITQALKNQMRSAQRWNELSDDKKEALDMIQHKIGRILNGDPNYHDSWHDVVGYAKLVADTLTNKTANEEAY